MLGTDTVANFYVLNKFNATKHKLKTVRTNFSAQKIAQTSIKSTISINSQLFLLH